MVWNLLLAKHNAIHSATEAACLDPPARCANQAINP